MSNYDYVINNMRFSYSSVSSFETCALGFKLNYIDSEDRVGNWYADYGLLIHQVLEKYFKDELKREWLKDYFVDNYSLVVTSDPPPFPAGIVDKYYADGLIFFDNLPINRDDYDVISIEDKIEAEHEGIKLVVKPDLIVKEKLTGKTLLMDFKTSKPMKGKNWDLVKIEGYSNQLLLYAYFLEKVKGIKIDKIQLLFVRLGKVYDIDYSVDNVEKVLSWFVSAIKKIKWEEDWKETVNPFFCQQICGVRRSCPYSGC
jgi:CRISPR/Cas system-associated exonuclease Cas4 (RecB family)